MTNRNDDLSLLDNDQLIKREHEQTYDAKRVFIVGGQVPDYSEQIKDGLKNLTITSGTSEVKIERIEVPVIVKEIEIRTIEVPTVVKETLTVEIPVIVIQKEVQIIEIPTIVERVRIVEIPAKMEESKLMHWLLIAQTLASIILSIIHLSKK